MNSVRIDKWLWAVRLYKTRTLAADACRAGHVKISGQPVKPAREVRPGDVIAARAGEINRIVKVIGLIEQRVGAKLVTNYLEDQTPPAEYQKPREPYFPSPVFRKKGAGRPTKKERRATDQFKG